MSQPSEMLSEDNKTSHDGSETHSELKTKLEESSMASENDVLLSIRFPSPPNFHTPYLHNWDFLDAGWARKYIMKHFNLENIREGL